MRSVFRDGAVLDDENTIRGANGGQPMRDDKARASGEDLLQAFLDALFGLGVDRRRRFVHNEDLRLGEDRTRKRDQLLLTGRQKSPALANLEAVSARELLDEIVCPDARCGFYDFFARRSYLTVSNIVRHSATEEMRRLKHDSELRLQPQQTALAIVDAIDQDLAGGRFLESTE